MNEMRDVTSKFKSSLTCSYCSKIFKEPIELPCDDYVCEEHLTETNVVKQNKIECATCKKSFEINGETFKSVKPFKRLLDDQVYLSDEEINLKLKIKESLDVFYKIYEEFISNRSKVSLDCKNHFQEVRRQIDLTREKLKENIDVIAMEMIDKTNEFEMSYLKSLNDNIEVSLKMFEKKNYDVELKEIDDKFRNPNLLIESIKEMQLKQKKDVAEIQIELNKMMQANKNLKSSNEFKSDLIFNKELFGTLHLNEYSTIESAKSNILASGLSLSGSSKTSNEINIQRFSPLSETHFQVNNLIAQIFQTKSRRIQFRHDYSV
jgi:hypothetical protein